MHPSRCSAHCILHGVLLTASFTVFCSLRSRRSPRLNTDSSTPRIVDTFRFMHHLCVTVIWRCISAGTPTIMSMYCCYETSTVFGTLWLFLSMCCTCGNSKRSFAPSGCLCHWSLSGPSGSHFCTLSLIGLRLMFFHSLLAVCLLNPLLIAAVSNVDQIVCSTVECRLPL